MEAWVILLAVEEVEEHLSPLRFALEKLNLKGASKEVTGSVLATAGHLALVLNDALKLLFEILESNPEGGLDRDGFVRVSGLGFYCVPCFVGAGHG